MTYGSNCELSTWAELGETFPCSSNSDSRYSWKFEGWAKDSTTSTSIDYSDGQTFKYNIDGNIDLYAVGCKKYYF